MTPWPTPPDLERRLAAIRDRATVAMLMATSSPAARMLYRYELRAGLPAYDHPTETRAPLRLLSVCAAPDCFRRFEWHRGGPNKRYCSTRCRARAWAHRRKEAA